MTRLKEVKDLQRRVSLKDYTSLKVGGKAKYFLVVKTPAELIQAITTAQRLKWPFYILGSGSNLLVSDRGFWGLVIKIQLNEVVVQDCKIVAGAGLSLGQLLNIAKENSLTGLEWAVAIPGTVGGAVYGNAGAFTGSMKDVIEKVEIYDINTGQVKWLSKAECSFTYRSSIFKNNKNLIILSLSIVLAKGRQDKIEEKIKEHFNYKKERHPWDYPSAGSIFKNPEGYFAAQLIEAAGLKGKVFGAAKVSTQHANFIVNTGKAKAKDIKKLINFIKKTIKKKHKINLVEEIQYLGF